MATLITLKLRKKNILFTNAITSLIWVFLKFLVQRTETLLPLFRLRTEFFYVYSGFPLSSKKQQSTFQFGLSHPYIGPRSRTLPKRHKPVPNLWGALPPPRDPECGRRRATSWIDCDPKLKLINILIN